MLIAERCSVSDVGQLMVINTYNVKPVTSFPCEIRDINLAIGLIFEPTDWGKLVHISIRIVDPDGQELASLNMQPVSFAPPHPGYPASWFNTIGVNVLFPREGTYVFELHADGTTLNEVPLYVGPLPK